MNRLGIRTLANPTLTSWRGVLASAAVLAALGFAAASPAKADDVPRASTGSNYVQYEHDARVHSQQLMESRAADAEAASDRALVAQQDRERQAAQEQNGAQQAHNLATPSAATNQ